MIKLLPDLLREGNQKKLYFLQNFDLLIYWIQFRYPKLNIYNFIFSLLPYQQHYIPLFLDEKYCTVLHRTWRFPADLVTFTEKKLLMENLVFCTVQIACGCLKILWDFYWITEILLLLTFIGASQLPKHPGNHYNPKKLGIHFPPETIIFYIGFSNFDHFMIFLPVLFL